MRLGYPCINRSVGCTANTTFRLASYSEDRLKETISANLECLLRTLGWNVEHGLLFFRIGSGLVPFASHQICGFSWAEHFGKELRAIGSFAKRHGMRISMHPDQFVLLNSPDNGITERSVRELAYHCSVLDSMGLDKTAKVQIHVGGVYGDREAAIGRFVERYRMLGPEIRKRLVIENDDRLYGVGDCLLISAKTGIPVVFDSFHHECLNNGERMRKAILLAAKTWKNEDGPPMLDYSSARKGGRKGSHAESLDARHFRRFLGESHGLDFDLMLEIKDKELSALKAAGLIDYLK